MMKGIEARRSDWPSRSDARPAPEMSIGFRIEDAMVLMIVIRVTRVLLKVERFSAG